MAMSYGEMQKFRRAEKFETIEGKFSVRDVHYICNNRLYFRDMPSIDMKRVNKRDLQRALRAEIDYYRKLLSEAENYSEVE